MFETRSGRRRVQSCVEASRRARIQLGLPWRNYLQLPPKAAGYTAGMEMTVAALAATVPSSIRLFHERSRKTEIPER